MRPKLPGLGLLRTISNAVVWNHGFVTLMGYGFSGRGLIKPARLNEKTNPSILCLIFVAGHIRIEPRMFAVMGKKVKNHWS